MSPYARTAGSLIKTRTARGPRFMTPLRDAAAALAWAIVLLSPARALPAPANPVGAASSADLITVCVAGNPWLDGGFEATSSTDLTNPNYPVVFSTHFPTGHPAGTPPSGTPLCNKLYPDCQDGTNAPNTPRTGNSWAWFGGNNANDDAVEIASAEQTITFPSGASSVTLDFYLRIGFVTAPFTDTLEVQVDDVTQQLFAEPSTPEGSYTLRSLDLTAFADGAAHTIKFLYTQATPANDNKANFDVDDVTLDIACAPLTPMALAVDPSGNGVLEPGEVASVEPTWKNDSGAQISLTGDSSNFNGPAGPTYDNPDTTADYGTVGAGASAQCTDCYTVEATAANRPATHWDATIDEAAGAGAKTWTLHLGDSFSDVPHDAYYPFIETIFHNGVTGGCGAGVFCPEALTSRGQMAVFLLAAAGITPPACTPPGIFSDVPCPGGFADWIEELYNLGITAGCNASPLQYCPDSPVTRAEMAVFLLATAGITPPACTPPGIFSDVPCPGGFTDWIEELYNLGITAGCNASPLQYCPDDPTPRNQMAVFLTTTFNLLLYGP
jgi:S-layer homology domain